ncbi:hypothetical protein GUITHDRAFT_107518 [Guillardia theta CCMP2712]|uniref:Uncharacterized protein n=2 Tax=Guillardia theta (strain CCMP2712) TaxID=905079 RepID=L1JE02_GUITC|nr:hypothetical protein GUITHDRAFT_107518 [Guillardia theta CCMP2712]EKX46741.1 hypothetical protein GUITHDRAFT_107518 [Guillardia theta CCMP2712]|eukprot:XP_005833721.1 hypothetical protein GUITHDRAFT_107518 [Guillardia theta CCMP2712]
MDTKALQGSIDGFAEMRKNKIEGKTRTPTAAKSIDEKIEAKQSEIAKAQQRLATLQEQLTSLQTERTNGSKPLVGKRKAPEKPETVETLTAKIQRNQCILEIKEALAVEEALVRGLSSRLCPH